MDATELCPTVFVWVYRFNRNEVNLKKHWVSEAHDDKQG